MITWNKRLYGSSYRNKSYWMKTAVFWLVSRRLGHLWPRILELSFEWTLIPTSSSNLNYRSHTQICINGGPSAQCCHSRVSITYNATVVLFRGSSRALSSFIFNLLNLSTVPAVLRLNIVGFRITESINLFLRVIYLNWDRILKIYQYKYA